MPGVPIINSLRELVAYRHIAIPVEDAKSVAMFEDEGRGTRPANSSRQPRRSDGDCSQARGSTASRSKELP